MQAFPSYYIPKGVTRPNHLPVGMAAMALRPGHKGPDGMDTEGAMVLGVEFRAGMHWKKSRAGWWINLDNVRAATLRKTYCHPGEIVTRSYPDGEADIWMVPQLLTIQPDGQPGYAIVERRDYSWRPPIALEHLMDRLRATVMSESDVNDDDAVSLVADILSVNYWISLHELELSGWLTPAMILEVIEGAAGMTAAKRDLAGGGNG